MDRIDIINKYFLSFNRDPYQNQNLVKFFISETNKFSEYVLASAVKDLRAEDGPMPKIGKFISHCKKLKPQRVFQAVPCNKCGGNGLIYKVMCRRPDGTAFEINSMKHTIIEGAHFLPVICGRCECINGEEFDLSSHSSVVRVVDPPAFLQKVAAEKGIDCAYAASVVATSYRHKARGYEGSKEPSAFSQSINGLIKKAMSDLYGMNDSEIEDWFKNNTNANPKDCKAPDELEFFTPWNKEDDPESSRFK